MLIQPYSYYGDLGHAYPSGDEACIIGLCTGQLASAAVSSSRTVGELIPVGVETVVLALRLGMCVLRVQELIEPGKSGTSSWSVLVSGMREPEAQDLIQKFAKQNVSFEFGSPIVNSYLYFLGFAPCFSALYQCSEPQWTHDQRSPHLFGSLH